MNSLFAPPMGLSPAPGEGRTGLRAHGDPINSRLWHQQAFLACFLRETSEEPASAGSIAKEVAYYEIFGSHPGSYVRCHKAAAASSFWM